VNLSLIKLFIERIPETSHINQGSLCLIRLSGRLMRSAIAFQRTRTEYKKKQQSIL